VANRERGEVSLEVGDQRYTLVLTLGGMCELEEQMSTPETEVTFPQIMARASRGSMRATRGIVWASSREYHPELSLKDIEKLIQKAGGILKFQAVLTRIYESAQPDEEDLPKEDPNRPPQAQAGTGARSTSKRVA